MNLNLTALIVLIIGLPGLILLPEPELNENSLQIEFELVSQRKFDDFSYVNFRTSTTFNSQMISNITLPKTGKLEVSCNNNEFSIINVYG